MSAHTPGPWEAGDRANWADVYTSPEDAYLIAAAPELLKALENLLSRNCGGSIGNLDREIVVRAWQAVAAARGETT